MENNQYSYSPPKRNNDSSKKQKIQKENIRGKHINKYQSVIYSVD